MGDAIESDKVNILATADCNTQLLPTSHSGTRSNAPKSELLGYVLVALSALAFASNVICVRVAEARYGLLPYQVVYILSLVITALAAAYLCLFTPSVRGVLACVTPRLWAVVVTRGILGALTCILLYSAVSYVPPGDADAIYFTSPVFIMLLSRLFLNEHMTIMDAAIAALSVCGAALVSVSLSVGGDDNAVSDGSHKVTGVLLAVAAALSNSTGIVLARSAVMGSTVHYMLLVFALGACAIPISLALGGYVPLSFGEQWQGPAAALACAVFGFVAQTLMHAGLQYTRAGVGSLVRNIEVPFVYILAVVILHEAPTALRLFGSALVVGSAVTIGVRQMVRASP